MAVILVGLLAGCGGDGDPASTVRAKPTLSAHERAQHLLRSGAADAVLDRVLADFATVHVLDLHLDAAHVHGDAETATGTAITDRHGNCSGRARADGVGYRFVQHGDEHLETSNEGELGSVLQGRWVRVSAQDLGLCRIADPDRIEHTLSQSFRRIAVEQMDGRRALHLRNAAGSIDVWVAVFGDRILPLASHGLLGEGDSAEVSFRSFDHGRPSRLPPPSSRFDAGELGLEVGSARSDTASA